MIEVRSGFSNPPLSEAVFFPFDDVSVPFSAGLRLHLVPCKKGGIVLRPGQPGEPDDQTVRFYGTVLQVNDELRMWYQARGSLDRGPESGRQRRLCHAVSRDGVRWEKPPLGLVEYNGTSQNNIVGLLAGRCVLGATPILHDPDDPDPSRRFKTAFQSEVYQDRLAVAFSPDGLRWTESPRNPVGPRLEQSGLIKRDRCYYVNGQGGAHFGALRKLVTHASYDFERWTPSSCLGLRRDSIPPRRTATERNTDEEVHLGAGLSDRGNVLLGVYGMWHGHPTGDPNLITMDLGLVVSHDALHYREPIPDFRLIPCAGEPGIRPGTGPALTQGQGMCNVGDRTLFWYETWRDGDVRLAFWPRDRLGYFEAFQTNAPHCVTCPMRLDGSAARVCANVDGLSEHTTLTVELSDARFHPLPGYSGDDAVPLRASGLRQPVAWKKTDLVRGIGGPFRLRASIGGLRPEDARLYALYVTSEP